MKNPHLFVAFVISGIIFFSCTQESDVSRLSDGMLPVSSKTSLHFASEKEFFDAVDEFTHPNADIRLLEEKYGFKSLLTYLEDIADRLESITDSVTFREAAKCYEDYFIVDEHGMLHPRYKSLGYLSIANRDGIFYVGDKLYRVTPSEIEIYSPDSVRTKSSQPERIPYSFPWSCEASQVTRGRGDVFIDRFYIANKRRLWVRAYTVAYFTSSGNNTYNVKYSFEFHAFQYFYNWLGIYKKEKTTFYFDSVLWSFAIPSKHGLYTNPSGYLKSGDFNPGDNASFGSQRCKNYYLTYNHPNTFVLNYPYVPDVRIMRFRGRSNETGNCGIVENFNIPATYTELKQCR